MAATTSTSLGLFAYPWDILDRGIAGFIGDCRRWRITRLHVPTLYHSGKFLLPRNRRNRVYFPEPGSLYVSVPEACFGKLKPPQGRLAGQGWLEPLARAAADAGISLAAWTIFHHNSTLGAKHPDLVVRNLFGDAYPFALCPSHPEVQEYSVALARAIASTGAFDLLDLETIGYLGYFHGHHHEFAGVPMGPLEQFLLSLCFCDACRTAGGKRGIDMAGLAAELEGILAATMRCDDAGDSHPDNMEQLAALIALSPPLQQFIALRLDAVGGLVRRIREQTSSMRLSVCTSGFVGVPSNIWMEGVSIGDLRTVVDGFHLLEYSPGIDTCHSDVAFCLALVQDPALLDLTLNLGLPTTPTLHHAAEKIERARRLGVSRFSFYNYGFLGEGRLRWLEEIASLQA